MRSPLDQAVALRDILSSPTHTRYSRVQEVELAGRPKEFSVNEAIHVAMEHFWAWGYEGSTLTALVRKMGISRQSLYDTFGDKRRLYLAALDRYTSVDLGALPATLEEPEADLGAIHRYFHRLVSLLVEEPRRGCLLSNAASEIGTRDAEVVSRVRAHLRRLENGFARALQRAVRTGELLPAGRIPTLARYLATTTQGLCVLAKAGASRAEMEEVVSVTVGAVAGPLPATVRVPSSAQRS